MGKGLSLLDALEACAANLKHNLKHNLTLFNPNHYRIIRHGVAGFEENFHELQTS